MLLAWFRKSAGVTAADLESQVLQKWRAQGHGAEEPPSLALPCGIGMKSPEVQCLQNYQHNGGFGVPISKISGKKVEVVT